MSRRNADRLLFPLLAAAGLVSGGLVTLIATFLLQGAAPAIRDAGLARFLTDPSWHPTRHAVNGSFNLLPMIVATAAVTLGAVLLATPVGVLSALFCRSHGPRPLRAAHRVIVELLAGIPSVVYGLWGLTVLAPLLSRIAPPGQSLLAGIVILTLMLVPTIALMTGIALSRVPEELRQAAAALGLSRWTTFISVEFPVARAGILAGILLAGVRALGETMAVLMVCGNVVQMPGSMFDPVRPLTANIALEMAYAMDTHRSALFLSGLVLLSLVAALVIGAELLTKGRLYG